MRAVLLEDHPGRGAGCSRGGGRETESDLVAVAQERGTRSPEWDGGCENGSKGKWVEEIVRKRSLGGGS